MIQIIPNQDNLPAMLGLDDFSVEIYAVLISALYIFTKNIHVQQREEEPHEGSDYIMNTALRYIGDDDPKKCMLLGVKYEQVLEAVKQRGTGSLITFIESITDYTNDVEELTAKLRPYLKHVVQ